MKKTALFLLLAALSAVNCRAANPYAGKFYASGDVKKAQFALTFDDGPGYITEDLLKLLEKHGAKATFFLLGSNVKTYPARAKKVLDAGHLLASHTYEHKNWFKVGKSADNARILAGELEKTAAVFEKAAGFKPWMLRMPNGYDRPWVRQEAARLGYTLVNWTYGSDWEKTPEDKMTAQYLKALKPGAILLMHDGGGKNKGKNLKVTEALLDEAARRGLKPVRLDALLGLGAPGK